MLDLGGNTITTSGAFSMVGGTLQNGTIVNSGSNYVFSSGFVSASLEGSAGLTMTGPGLLQLTGANSYSGTTAVNGGTLQVAGPASLPNFSTPGQVTVAAGAALWVPVGGSGFASSDLDSLLANATFSASNAVLGLSTSGGDFVYASNITPNLSLQVLGPNVLTLAGNNTYGGATTIGGGTLSLASASALPGGNISFAGGVLQYSASNTADYSSQIVNSTSAMAIDTNGQNVTYNNGLAASNAGGLTKLGGGMLTLSASSAYKGGTIVSAGTLVAGADAALGAAAGNVLLNPDSSATLAFTSPSPTIAALSSSGAGAASVVLGNPGGAATTLTTNSTATTTYSGSISDLSGAGGGAGSLIFTGAGVRTLAGAVNLSGSVTVGNGTVNVPAGGSLIVSANTLAISNANSAVAVLNLNGGLISVPGFVRGIGGTAGIGSATLNLNGGTLQATASNGAFLQQMNAVNVNANTAIDTQANSIAIGQSMLGSGGLTKAGNGVLTLAAPNVYSGGTTLGAGTLAATGPENFGSGPVTLAGGVLALQAASVPLAISNGFNTNVIATTGITQSPGGTIDGTYFLYQAGLAGAPATTLGMPIGGGLMSLSNTAVTFQLANYSIFNDLSMGTATATTGTLILANPAKFSQLNILSTDGSGSKPYSMVLNFADGTQGTYSLSGSDWFNNSPYAIGGVGRTTTTSFDAGAGTGPLFNPRLYESDVTLAGTDPTKVVNSITFNYTGGGTTRVNVFAISGAENAQSYANAVNVTNNAAIDVSQSLQASVGALSINSHTLSLTSADTSGSTYSLTTGPVSLTGNPTFNVSPSAGRRRRHAGSRPVERQWNRRDDLRNRLWDAGSDRYWHIQRRPKRLRRRARWFPEETMMVADAQGLPTGRI